MVVGDGQPVVGIVMGSDSDWSVMSDAGAVLAELGVPHEVGVVSAHRMPHAMLDYAATAAGRGLRVLVAGAGAAHLPGMLASVTSLPVIGVPVPLQHLGGLDSLLSIVRCRRACRWPRFLSAARVTPACSQRILAASDAAIRERLDAFRTDLEAARRRGRDLRDRLG